MNYTQITAFDKNLFNQNVPELPSVRHRGHTHHWRNYPMEEVEGIVMQGYWSEWVLLMMRFLPHRFVASRSDLKMLNLGAGSGAYQKEWQRLGFNVYGVEISERLVADLRKYGCKGEVGNIFFDMASIPDESYDFLIMDRVLGGLSLQKISPPYFRECIRKSKHDSAFLVVFGHFWTEDMIEELSQYGAITIAPLFGKGDHDVLLVLMDRTLLPAKVETIDAFNQRMLEWFNARSLNSQEVCDYLSESGVVNHVTKFGDKVRCLHLISNFFVEYVRCAEGWELGLANYWIKVPWRCQHLYGHLTLESDKVHPQQRKLSRSVANVFSVKGRPRVMVIGDQYVTNKNGRKGFARYLYSAYRYKFRFVHIPYFVRGSKVLLANIENWMVAEPNTVVLSAGLGEITRSKKLTFSQITRFRKNLASILEQLEGYLCIKHVIVTSLLTIPKFDEAQEHEIERINSEIAELNQIILDCCQAKLNNGVVLFDLNQELSGVDLFEGGGTPLKSLSPVGERLLAEKLGQLILMVTADFKSNDEEKSTLSLRKFASWLKALGH